MGTRVQIGHFFDGHHRKILTAYPRMFDDNEYIEMDPGSSYHVSFSHSLSLSVSLCINDLSSLK